MEKLPCEEVVWDTLPAIRAAIAVELVSSGLSQKNVADLLNMAPSAVSQYLSGKRGYRIEFTLEVKETLATLAKDLREGRLDNPGPRICSICTLIRGDAGACGACDDPVEDESSL
ncbi:MAG TPA: transcriptional regulator [Methanospirillum sp.]|nr:transcriptional regulator [Methanospirillum sp.]